MRSRIDRILTHRLWGLLIFIGIIWLMFFCTFSLGAYPQNWIEALMGWLSSLLEANMAESWIKDFLQQGIIDGVGAVLAFLPNIIILFFFMSILQESNYLSRAATVMDKYMHFIGLHGSSFIPMLMGFGCNVPAIMATRTIERRSDRILTMLAIPYIPCSARMPVFLVFSGIFFREQQVLVMLLLYGGSILIGILVALLYKFVFFRAKSEDYTIELPELAAPSFIRSLKVMWEAASEYLNKIGTVVLLAVVIIWALDYFPLKKEGDLYRESYLEQFGHAVEPVMEPLGFDWKMSVALVTGISAKEFIVSTLGVLYQGDENIPENDLAERLAQDPHFTRANTLSFMIFSLLYLPCIATAATIKKESNSWKWATVSIISTLGVAWIISFIVFRIALIIF
ncbi:MAG: ferrous iron transport protein B [Bacteroidales bacterium]|nr:ferrous iron transport protein B [Bacteroidales bacterium]